MQIDEQNILNTITKLPCVLIMKLICHSKTKYGTKISRKEVFQPHLPVRLPCYDLAPVASFALSSFSRALPSGTPNSHGLTGGVYKVRERIHRIVADMRLLAIPTSWSRVADSNPNCDRLFVIRLLSLAYCTLYRPL